MVSCVASIFVAISTLPLLGFLIVDDVLCCRHLPCNVITEMLAG
uniref:Uncharacterized protein n=1 Tax=Aegilops tauschii subsp. strangulata TaxID=200361 RepID=A0A453HSC4_AEGTS